MAKAVGVGQVAEWSIATVLKTPQVERSKARKPRISNENKPRITRTERTSQRFAMAQMSAHINRAGKTLARPPALTATNIGGSHG